MTHADCRYARVAALLTGGMTTGQVCAALGLTPRQVQQARRSAKRAGLNVPDRTISGAGYAIRQQYLAALQVGSINDLLNVLGVDQVRHWIGQMPEGANLATFLGSVLTDAYLDDMDAQSSPTIHHLAVSSGTQSGR